jgi:predicted ATPase
VGPVREQLARLYVRDEVRSVSVDDPGQATVRFGTARTDKPRRTRGTGELRERLRDQNLCNQVNGALSRLGVGYELSVEPQELQAFEGAGAEAVVLTDTVNNVRVGMQDVGYGVGQVIPLIAEVMTLGSRTLLIEQPELHLHPGLQANLGEVLVDAIKRFPDGQIIAETHSEHVILRIMRMVRDKQISPEKIHIIYVDSEHKRARSITNIRINPYGEYVGTWPGGFFEERMNELF